MKIFIPVHCKAYLKKFHDGVHLATWERKGNDSFYCDFPAKGNRWNEPIIVKAMKDEYTEDGWKQTEIADLSDFEGNTVSKQYRQRVEEEFDGFLVGFTWIVVSGEIGTDTSTAVYNMNGDLREVYHLTKQTLKEKVAVVYFKNNAKRYVPLYDFEEKEA